jgi:thiamine-monophosphate kinase
MRIAFKNRRTNRQPFKGNKVIAGGQGEGSGPKWDSTKIMLKVTSEGLQGMTSAGTGELELIRRIKANTRTRNAGVRVGIGDDCAILKVLTGQEVVVTTDLCLEGRHFRRDWHSAESAGHRCLARGLSDVAAMGARPVAAFLSVALPHGFDEGWFDRFMAGFQALAARYDVELAGGDTGEATGEEIMADVVVIGALNKMRAMRRVGARVGDGIFVTGSLGGAAAELKALAEGVAWAGSGHPQTFPEPRMDVGLTLMRRGWATACMDISDGLSSDLRQICAASGVRAEVDLDRIPMAAGATLEQALNGGEDYELLFTAMAGVKVPKQLAAVWVTRIGTMIGGEGPLVQVAGGEELLAGGWEHLA